LLENNVEKNLDIELLLFYLGVSILSFILYIVRHPILMFYYDSINIKAMISAYFLDLIILLSFFIPYIIIILVLIFIKLRTKAAINDNIFVVLFFPILSFFAKGMSLLQVYIYSSFWEILKDNFAFFSFFLIGPCIILLNKLIVHIQNKYQKGRNEFGK